MSDELMSGSVRARVIPKISLGKVRGELSDRAAPPAYVSMNFVIESEPSIGNIRYMVQPSHIAHTYIN